METKIVAQHELMNNAPSSYFPGTQYLENIMSISIKALQGQLPFPIKETLLFGDLIITIIDDEETHRHEDKILNRNVYAFSANGTLKWQIQEAPGVLNDALPYGHL